MKMQNYQYLRNYGICLKKKSNELDRHGIIMYESHIPYIHLSIAF